MHTICATTKILVALLVAAYALSFAGRAHFMLDNLASFKAHFAIAFLVSAIAMLAARQHAWLALASVGLVVSLVEIAPWYAPMQEARAAGGNTLSVMSSNVSPRNPDTDRLVALVEEQSPDVLGLIELTPRFLAGLTAVRENYPHRFEAPEEGYWGMALYSRQPLSDARLVHFGDDVPPAISVLLTSGSAVVELILVHPYPPMTARLAAQRNVQMARLAEYIAGTERPTVVLGDLNATMWSPHYRDFVEVAGLRNVREGGGVAGTWPPSAALGVPIDHVLGTHEIGLADFRVLRPIGSDHLPIAATITLPDVS